MFMAGNRDNRGGFQYVPTPQADFKKLKLSPNAAEGKERNGLKDLGNLVAAKQQNAPSDNQNPQNTPPEPVKESPIFRPPRKQGNNKNRPKPAKNRQ